jgi:hypothetical protein
VDAANMTIERRPFLISEHTVMLVTLFHKPHDMLADIWMHDYLPPLDAGAKAAKQLVEQLEDRWSPHFLMELRKAISEKLAECDRDRGGRTKFAEFTYP